MTRSESDGGALGIPSNDDAWPPWRSISKPLMNRSRMTTHFQEHVGAPRLLGGFADARDRRSPCAGSGACVPRPFLCGPATARGDVRFTSVAKIMAAPQARATLYGHQSDGTCARGYDVLCGNLAALSTTTARRCQADREWQRSSLSGIAGSIFQMLRIGMATNSCETAVGVFYADDFHLFWQTCGWPENYYLGNGGGNGRDSHAFRR